MIASEEFECNFKKDGIELKNEIHVTCELENIVFDGIDTYNIIGNRSVLLTVTGIDPEDDYVEEDRIDDFVTKIKFKSSRISKIPNLIFQKFEQLRVFDGSSIDLHNITALSFNGAANLIIILLQNNQLTAINDNSFVHTKNLKTLDLSNNKIKKISVNAFTALANLEELSLSSNNIKTLDGVVFRPLKLLRWIWLDRNHLSVIPTNSFLPKMNENLHGIYLNNNQISKISPIVFDRLPSLRFLMLNGNNCTNKNFKDHRINENASVKFEMFPCFKEYRKDKNLMKDDEKFNVTKSVKRLENSIKICFNETSHIETEIVNVEKQVKFLRLSRDYNKKE